MEDIEVKKNRNKGFTLIELLAVIVILGILMAVAIPAMTQYIENSKKDVFWQTAKMYVNSARYGLLNDEYVNCPLPATGEATAIPTSAIQLEKGSKNSGWNKEMKDSYVICVNEGESDEKPKYVYYYAGRDAGSNGIKSYTQEDQLKRSAVSKGDVTTIPVPTEGSNLALGASSRIVRNVCGG